MIRPTFLMAEPEPPEGLSTRKLVLETGKFNVITAYSEREALELFEKFRESTAVILHSSIFHDHGGDLIDRLKELKPGVPVIVLTPQDTSRFPGADYQIPSHEPQELLNLVRELFGDPRPADQMQSRT
jgi:DNA-binding response OmpR family regulator